MHFPKRVFYFSHFLGRLKKHFSTYLCGKCRWKIFPNVKDAFSKRRILSIFPIKKCTFGCLLEKMSCQFLWCRKCFYLLVWPSLYVQPILRFLVFLLQVTLYSRCVHSFQCHCNPRLVQYTIISTRSVDTHCTFD